MAPTAACMVGTIKTFHQHRAVHIEEF